MRSHAPSRVMTSGVDDVEVYVNSLLATLNARAVTIKHLLENQESSPAPPISTDMEFATMNTQLTSSPDKVRCNCRNYNAPLEIVLKVITYQNRVQNQC